MALIINVGLSAVSCHPCPFLFRSTESKIQTGNPVQFVTMVSSCHLTCDLLCNLLLLLLLFSSGHSSDCCSTPFSAHSYRSHRDHLKRQMLMWLR